MLIIGPLSTPITLTTISPFILEGTCILIIFIPAILLAVPLLSRVKTQLFGSRKKINEAPGGIEPIDDAPSTTNYPCSLPPLPSESGEQSVPHWPYPTPLNKSSDEESSVNNDENCLPPGSRKLVKNPSVRSNRTLNESTLVTYNSYRHKLIEETLQKRYGGGYAPGDVILNLIELNTIDSAASLVLSKKYNVSFFDEATLRDGIVGLYKTGQALRDVDLPDPLAHFIPRYLRKASTSETQTGTARPSEISLVIKPSARPNTPTSCQVIIPQRFRAANCGRKSPFATPVHSQAPLNARSSFSQRGRDQRSDLVSPGKCETGVDTLQNFLLLRDRSGPLTEQLYRRADTRPDVVSRTHVEAEEYLDRIARNAGCETSVKRGMISQPRIRSSLKKSRRRENVGEKLSPPSSSRDNDNARASDDRTGDRDVKPRRSFRDDVGHLSASKPSIWNN